MDLRALAESKRAFKGTSKAAEKRRAEANRGTVIAGRPGETVKTRNGKRAYFIAPDGSFRRVKDTASKGATAEMYIAISRETGSKNDGPTIKPATMSAMVEAAIEFDAFISGKFEVATAAAPALEPEDAA